MKSRWKRLAFAACFSLASAGATYYWYSITSSKKSAHAGETPIAQAAKVGDEVLQRPATRLLWHQVDTGDNLYPGETIRTSAKGELRIQFKDGRYIDIEPESLIVLSKNEKEISLDLLDGSLTVNSKEAQGPAETGISLNSGKGKVDLSQAHASISKGTGDRIDMKVLEGTAKIKSADGHVNEISQGKSSSLVEGKEDAAIPPLTIMAPLKGKPVFVDPDSATVIAFKWEGAQPETRVSVFTGATKKELRERVTASEDGGTEASAKLALGKHWFKLVAKNVKTGKIIQESVIERLDVRGRFAPSLLSPAADSDLHIDNSPTQVSFKWQAPLDAKSVRLEVATDREMANAVLNKTFDDGTSAVTNAMTEGEYFVRLAATYPEVEKPIVGKVQHFRMFRNKKDPAKIIWKMTDENTKQFFGKTPELTVTWDAASRQEEIARYVLKLSPEGTNDSVEITAKAKTVKTPVPGEGRYIASVEAYDKEGKAIGKSDPLTLTSAPAPLIAAPNFIPAEGPLKSGADGHTELRWNEVDGAKEYWLTVHSAQGKQMLNRKYDSPSAKLKNLMPGSYNIKVEAVDGYGRRSVAGKERKLEVPDTSNINSPKLKKVQVE